jgi:hypothetical protein
VVGQLFARVADDKLGKDVQKNLSRLFRERSAQVVPNEAAEYAVPRAFDHAVATVATTDLDLRFTRTGGEFSVDVAAPGERSWKSPQARTWGFGHDWTSLDWASIDSLLAEHWEDMKAAASD